LGGAWNKGLALIDDTIPEKIDQMRIEICALTQSVGGLQDQVRLLAEMNRRLIEILTPEKKGGGGELAAALAKLVQDVERQNRLLEDHTSVLVRFVREIPGQVTTAVLGGTTGLLAAIRDLPGKVLLAVRDGFR
jgi:hypothetical protein